MKNSGAQYAAFSNKNAVSRRRFLTQTLLVGTGLALTEVLSPWLTGQASSQRLLPIDSTDGALPRQPYISRPAGSGPFPGVVVMQDWRGVGDSARRTADRLAAHGWTAIVPDLFEGRTANAPEEAQLIMASLDPIRVMTILHNAVKYLTQHEVLSTSQIGIVSSNFSSRYAIALSQQTLQVGGILILNGLHAYSAPSQADVQFDAVAEQALEESHLFEFPIANGSPRPLGGVSVRAWAPMLVLDPFLTKGVLSVPAFAHVWEHGVHWLQQTIIR